MKVVEANQVIEETEGRARILEGWQLKFVASIAFLWSIFQLWYASPFPFMLGFGVFIDVPARAIHLGFGLFLAFLSFPFYKKNRKKKFNFLNIFLALLSIFVTFYLFFNYENLVYRNGILLKQPIIILGNVYDFPTELLIGFIGIILLLEATRRAIGTPLVLSLIHI